MMGSAFCCLISPQKRMKNGFSHYGGGISSVQVSFFKWERPRRGVERKADKLINREARKQCHLVSDVSRAV